MSFSSVVCRRSFQSVEMSLQSSQAETQGKKQVQKIVLVQRERMLPFQQEQLDHPASGRFGAPDGAKNSKRRLLEEKTTLLNSCSTGASKSREKWMKSWQDCRSQNKSKASKLKRLRGGTGGGEHCLLSLANLEEPLPASLGPESASGQPNADPLEMYIAGPTRQPLNVLLQFENNRPSHQPSPALLEFADTSRGMAAQCPANGAAMEHIELTDAVPVGSHVWPPLCFTNIPPPQLSPSQASTSSSSSASCAASYARKRRHTVTKSSEHAAKSEAPVNIFAEINELMSERMRVKEQRLELKRKTLEIEKERLEMKREQSRVICEAVQNVSSSFCTAMQMVAQYFMSQRR